jgi:predicted DNA-binding protein
LPEELDVQLERAASVAERPKSELIRDAILAFLEHEERARFQAQIIKAVQARGGEDPVAIAEEFLESDNEALASGEARNVNEVRGRYRIKPRSRR